MEKFSHLGALSLPGIPLTDPVVAQANSTSFNPDRSRFSASFRWRMDAALGVSPWITETDLPRCCNDAAENGGVTSSRNPGAKSSADRHPQRTTGNLIRNGHSTVGITPVPDGRNLDRVLASEIEEHPIIGTPQSKAAEGRFELLDVARAAGHIPIYAVENLHRNFAVEGTEIGAGLRRPKDRHPRWRSILTHPARCTLSARTRAGSHRAGCPRHQRVKLGRGPKPRLFQR